MVGDLVAMIPPSKQRTHLTSTRKNLLRSVVSTSTNLVYNTTCPLNVHRSSPLYSCHCSSRVASHCIISHKKRIIMYGSVSVGFAMYICTEPIGKLACTCQVPVTCEHPTILPFGVANFKKSKPTGALSCSSMTTKDLHIQCSHTASDIATLVRGLPPRNQVKTKKKTTSSTVRIENKQNTTIHLAH